MDACMISIIAAVAQNGVIGQGKNIPWHLREDLKRFKKITLGHAVIMGRKTAESIGKALPQRLNIVITRKKGFWMAGFLVAHSWKQALAFLKKETEAFVIGGAEIYSLALPHAQRLYLTQVQAEVNGNVLFPKFEMSDWKTIREAEFKEKDAENDHDSTFRIFERRSFVVMENARFAEQREAMERIQARGECPFCEKNLEKEHTKPILSQGKFWALTENEWKYEAAKLHFLLIYRKHAEKLSDLDPAAGTELLEMLEMLEGSFNIASGAIGIRFGDMQLNGGTVAHLHVHVIVPYVPTDPEFKTLRFRMSAKEK